MLDLLGDDCVAFRRQLERVAEDAGLPGTLFRIAIEEVEAWYLGDREALALAYTRFRSKALVDHEQDSLGGTWERLAEAVYDGGARPLVRAGYAAIGLAKAEWARAIGPHMAMDRNASASFCKFRDGIRRLLATASTP